MKDQKVIEKLEQSLKFEQEKLIKCTSLLVNYLKSNSIEDFAKQYPNSLFDLANIGKCIKAYHLLPNREKQIFQSDHFTKVAPIDPNDIDDIN